MPWIRIFKTALFTLLAVAVLLSCDFSLRKHVHVSPETSACFPEKTYAFSPGNNASPGDTIAKRVYLIPDSLLTPQEIRIKRQFLHLLLTYLTVENNRYVFHLPKDSFLRQGIPGFYYDELIEGLDETNRWAEEMSVDSLPALFGKAREYARKELSPP